MNTLFSLFQAPLDLYSKNKTLQFSFLPFFFLVLFGAGFGAAAPAVLLPLALAGSLTAGITASASSSSSSSSLLLIACGLLALYLVD